MTDPPQHGGAFSVVSMHAEMNAGRRRTMEDAHVVIDRFGDRDGWGYVGVYDGHGGRATVDYIDKNLHLNILRDISEDNDTSIEDRLKSGFLVTDDSARTDVGTDDHSGCTAVVALVEPPSGRTGGASILHVANIGDSRAVLCRNGEAVRLSQDHKATDPAEAKRIEASGGFVFHNRVVGVLAVSRSFGDHAMKPYVCADPYVSTTTLGNDTPFLVVACDGLWDVMTDDEVVKFVQANVKSKATSDAAAAATEGVLRDSSGRPSTTRGSEGAGRETEDDETEATGCEDTDGAGGRSIEPVDASEIAEQLVEEALDRATADNVSVVVVFF